MSSTRIIKKYPNRRLYNTSRGRYITLEEIKALVLERADFQVVDARSNKDITQSTLLQIIMEQEASATPIFTTGLLQDIIRFYHENSQHLLTEYLQQVMALFKKQWQSYQHFLIDPSFNMQQFVKKMWSMEENSSAAQKKTSADKN